MPQAIRVVTQLVDQDDVSITTPQQGEVVAYDVGTDKFQTVNAATLIPLAITYTTGDIANPPTEAELEALLGDSATAGAGVAYVVSDNDTARAYFVVSGGTSWLYTALTIPAGGTAPTVVDILDLAPSGAWCWFSDPRAVHYNGKTYFAYIGNSGWIAAQEFTNATEAVSSVSVLHASLQIDDHASPSIMVRDSDKRLIAFYSKHNGNTIYQRTSTNAEDISAWGTEASLDASLGGAEYDYTIPIQLTGEANDPIYLYFRGVSGGVRQWYYSKSVDGGATWAAQTLLYQPASNLFPYIKAVANGTDRIDFVISDGSPNILSTSSIYHCYYTGGSYYQSDGTEIAGGLPLAVGDLTQVYDGTTNRAWLWDIAIDGSGNPVITYVTYPTYDTTHLYRYAHWTGSAWESHDVVTATTTGGIAPYPSVTYSGGVVIDPTDVNTLFLSRVVDGQWEIYKYVTADHGGSWTPTAITEGSAVKNIRPAAVRSNAAGINVLWLQGTYNSYTIYTLAVKGADA